MRLGYKDKRVILDALRARHKHAPSAILLGKLTKRWAVSPSTKRAVKTPGLQCEDLAGQHRGQWLVLSYLRPGKVTPVWEARCVRCKCLREITGAQLRNSPPECRQCGRQAPCKG